jgi:pimeloyl-ACP methyl ester carboxylesterase
MSPLVAEPIPTDAPRSLTREAAAERYFHSAQPDVLEWALDRITPESASVFNEMGVPPGVAIAPDAITCPLLVVTGEFDRTSVPHDDRIARYYGGEWLHDADNGHDLMLEAGWATLLDRIVAWLEPRVGRA